MAVPHSSLGRRRPFEWRAVVSSLTVRNYRLYFFGQLVSVAGTWMQTVAQSFLVLQPDRQRYGARASHGGPLSAHVRVRPDRRAWSPTG